MHSSRLLVLPVLAVLLIASIPTANAQYTYDLESVSMVSATDGWAVGSPPVTSNREAFIIHYTGGSWVKEPVPRKAMALKSVFMAPWDANKGWAVGEGETLLNYASGSWTEVPWGKRPPFVDTGLNSVYFTPGRGSNVYEGWAVGDETTILHYSSYTDQWLLDDVPGRPFSGVELNSVFMMTYTENNTNVITGWAAGTKGAILHYTGESCNTSAHPNCRWEKVQSPTSEMINSLYMYGLDGGWAVGVAGTILHYDGVTWVEIVRPVTDDLFSVIADKDEGWAVGRSGTILRYTNSSWTKVSTPTSANLYSLSVVYSNPLQFWAVGDKGTILHYTGTSWEVVQCPCQKVEEEASAAGSFGPGVFAVIGIGAVMAAVGIGLVVVMSSSEVYAHGGHYYCRKHNVPVVTVSGRPWCPVEGRYLRS